MAQQDLSVLLKILADTSSASNSVAEFRKNFKAALSDIGLSAGEIKEFSRLVADVDRGKVAVAGLDAKTQELLRTYQEGRQIASARDFLGLKSFESVQAEIAKTRAAFETLKNSGTLSNKELAEAASRAEAKIRDLEGGTRKGEASLASFATTAVKAAAALLAFDKLKDLGASLIDVSAKYGKLEASLNTVTDSAQEAGQAFETIQSFQAEAPIFSIEEITRAFVKLKSLGLDPSEEALRSYGNTASAMGKSLNDFAEAIADAVTGEFERLKEFGIKSQTEGDRVKFTFQGLTTEVGKNAQEIEAYLRQIGQTTFADGIANQSAEAAGSIGRIETAWEQLKKNLADAAGIKSILNGVADGFSYLKDQVLANAEVSGKSAAQLQSQHDALVRLKGGVEQGGAAAQWYADKLVTVNAALESQQQAEARTAAALDTGAKAKAAARQSAEEHERALGQEVERLDQGEKAAASHAKALDANHQARAAVIKSQIDGLQKSAEEFAAAGRTTEAMNAQRQAIDLIGQSRVLDLQRAADQARGANEAATAAEQHAASIRAKAAALDGISPKEQQAIAEAEAEAAARRSAATQAAAHVDALARLPESLRATVDAQSLQNAEVKRYYNEADSAIQAARRMQQAHVDGRASTDDAARATEAAVAAVARLSAASEAYTSGPGARRVDNSRALARALDAETEASRRRAEIARSEQSALENTEGSVIGLTAAHDAMGEQGTSAWKMVYDALGEYSTYLQAQMYRMGETLANTNDWWGDIKWGEFVTRQMEQAQAGVDALTGRIRRAIDTGTGLAAAARESAVGFGLLNEARLTKLHDAIDAAKAKLDSLRESSEQTLRGLQDRLDQLDGNQIAIKQRAYNAEREKLLYNLEIARKSGDAQLISNATQSLSTLEEINRREMAALRKKATGGWIPGVGNEDTEPYLLTPGEFVVNKRDAAKNAGLLERLNKGETVRMMAAGGLVRTLGGGAYSAWGMDYRMTADEQRRLRASLEEQARIETARQLAGRVSYTPASAAAPAAPRATPSAAPPTAAATQSSAPQIDRNAGVARIAADEPRPRVTTPNQGLPPARTAERNDQPSARPGVANTVDAAAVYAADASARAGMLRNAQMVAADAYQAQQTGAGRATYDTLRAAEIAARATAAARLTAEAAEAEERARKDRAAAAAEAAFAKPAAARATNIGMTGAPAAIAAPPAAVPLDDLAARISADQQALRDRIAAAENASVARAQERRRAEAEGRIPSAMAATPQRRGEGAPVFRPRNSRPAGAVAETVVPADGVPTFRLELVIPGRGSATLTGDSAAEAFIRQIQREAATA